MRTLVDARNRILMDEMLGTIKKIQTHIDEQKAASAAAKAFAERERNRVYVEHGKGPMDRREINHE